MSANTHRAGLRARLIHLLTAGLLLLAASGAATAGGGQCVLTIDPPGPLNVVAGSNVSFDVTAAEEAPGGCFGASVTLGLEQPGRPDGQLRGQTVVIEPSSFLLNFNETQSVFVDLLPASGDSQITIYVTCETGCEFSKGNDPSITLNVGNSYELEFPSTPPTSVNGGDQLTLSVLLSTNGQAGGAFSMESEICFEFVANPYAASLNGLGACGNDGQLAMADFSSGLAEVTMIAPPDICGLTQLTATAIGITPTQSLNFALTGTSVKALLAQNGDNQTTTVNTIFPADNEVLLRCGNTGVPNVNVTWEVQSGPAIFGGVGGPASTVSATNADGLASAQLFGGSTGGSVTLQACAGADCATFTNLSVQGVYDLAFADPGNGFIAVAPGEPTQLAVLLTLDGIPVTGELIEYAQTSGPPGLFVPDPPQQSTGADGQAAVTWSSAQEGAYTISATFNESPPKFRGPIVLPITREFNITVANPAVPGLELVAGDMQSAVSGQALASPLTVRATENGGAQSLPVDILWSVTPTDAATLSASTTQTDIDGLTEITVTLAADAAPGNITINAVRSDAPSEQVDFTATVLAPVVRSVTKPAADSGDGQTGSVNSTLPLPLRALALDSGVVAPGVTILWSVGDGATLSDSQTVTDGDGLTSVSLTFGSVAQSVSVIASRLDEPAATTSFVVTAVAAPVELLTTFAGDAQVGPPSQPGQLLKVEYTENGIPVPGVNVSWSVVSGSAVLASNSSSTDSSGHASMDFDFGATAGPVVVRAEAGANTVDFNLTIATLQLEIASGNSQTGAPAAPLADDFVARVIASPSNVPSLSGISITWTVIDGDGSVSESITTTDTLGLSSTRLTLGPQLGGNVVQAQLGNGASVAFTATAEDAMLTALRVLDGDGQTGLPGRPGQPLLVEFTRNGEPEQNINIFWTVLSGTASLASSNSITDSNGVGQTGILFGSNVGSVVVRAQVDELFVDFTMTIASLRLELVSGDAQQGIVGTSLADALVVRVVAEPSDVSLDGIAVSWDVLGGGGSVNDATSFTDALGQAATALTLGPEAGINAVRAQIANGSFVDFSATADTDLVPVAALRSVSGDAQTALPGQSGQALQVEYTLDGVPAAGTTIAWSVVSGAASLAGNASTTDANGLADIGITFGTNAGPVVVRAEVGELAVDFTMTIASLRLELVSGNNQQVAAGGVLADDLIARITSESGVTGSLEGIPVSWEVISGGGSLSVSSTPTDAFGLAGTRLTVGAQPGVNMVRASIAGGNSVEFSATGLSTEPSFVAVSGDGQRGTVQTGGQEPLVVELRDASGQPMAGRTIQWSVTGGAASVDQSSTMTNADGRASVGFRYGDTAGVSTVRARSDDADTEVDFQIEAAFGALTIVAGNGQAGTPGQPLPQEFVVAVSPSAAKSLSGVAIAWEVAQGDGSLRESQTIADANGEARNSLTLGSGLGVTSVVARIAGDISVVFQAEAVAGSGELRIVSGDNQSVPTNDQSAPLVIEVLDGSGVPLVGVRVDWTAVMVDQRTNLSLESESTLTDAQGRARNTARVLLPGTSRVRVRSIAIEGSEVEFRLNGGLANIPTLTPEQRQTSEVLDNACPALAALATRTPGQEDLFQRCVELIDNAGDNPGDVANALNQLPTQFADAIADAGFITLNTQQRNHSSRFETLRKGQTTRASDMQVGLWTPTGVLPLSLLPAAFGEDDSGGQEIGSDFSRWGFFATGTIGRGNSRGEQGANPGFNFDTSGLTAGVDYRFTDQIVGGVSIGYARHDGSLRRDSGELDTRGWALSGYATWFNERNWYVDGVVSYGVNDYRMARAISYSIGNRDGGRTEIDQIASGRTDGSLAGASVSVGRDFNRGAWNFSSYLRGNFARVQLDAYEETMLSDRLGTGLALRFDSRSLNSLSSSFGGKASYVISRDWGVLMPHAQVEWEHEYRDDQNRLITRFVHDPTGSPLEQFGTAVDSDYFNVGVGVSALFPGGRTAFIYYERLVGSSRMSQGTLSIGGRFEF